MPFAIRYNAASQLALSDLNKETSDACKSLKKVSEGQKITSAQDDDAGYVVSEKMIDQIRSLAQDKQNIQNGLAMLKIASGGVENIIEFLRDLRELAINAATDTNTDDDRAILQKKAEQILFSINDIAASTTYNSKNLIDGTFAKATVSGAAITITGDGVYDIPADFSGTIEINAQNVKLTSSGALSNVQIVSSSSGNANLWLSGLNITNDEDLSVVKMQGRGNTLTIDGTNNLSITAANAKSAVINVGGGTTIQGTDLTVDAYGGSATVNDKLNVTNNGGSGTGAGIGSDENGSGGNINISLGVEVTVDYTGTGAAIGSGAGGSIGDIKEAGGGGGDDEKRAIAVKVTHHNTIEGVNAIGYGLGGSAGSIAFGSGTGFEINATGTATASSIIHGGSASNSTPATIGSSNTAIVYLNGTEHRAGDDDLVIGSITFANYDASQSINVTSNVSEPTGDAATSENSSGGGGSSSSAKGTPLVIHSGTRSGQSLSFYLSNMHTQFLRGTIPNTTDAEHLAALQYDMDKYNAYADLLSEVQNLTLDDINLTTRENANKAIRLVEGALEYSLNEATNIGAYLRRLEHTEQTVTDAAENTQAAESTIRDADMAREMTNYTKSNVLSQAAQAVLAQANQNSGNVIQLLR